MKWDDLVESDARFREAERAYMAGELTQDEFLTMAARLGGETYLRALYDAIISLDDRGKPTDLSNAGLNRNSANLEHNFRYNSNQINANLYIRGLPDLVIASGDSGSGLGRWGRGSPGVRLFIWKDGKLTYIPNGVQPRFIPIREELYRAAPSPVGLSKNSSPKAILDWVTNRQNWMFWDAFMQTKATPRIKSLVKAELNRRGSVDDQQNYMMLYDL